MSAKVKTQAVVRLEIEIATGTYGAECTMQQILSQAATEATNAVNVLLKDRRDARVVGKPKVVAVSTAPEVGILEALLGGDS